MKEIKLKTTISSIPEEEIYSKDFLQGMINRMLMSHHKYGKASMQYPYQTDAIKNLKFRLHKYMKTGNAEFLIDVANFAMIEFMFPAHKEAHWDKEEKRGQHLV